MKHDPRVLLAGIERAGEKIERFTQNMDFVAYLDDERTQNAVERNFEIIGEALNRLHKISPELVERIPDAREIIGFRNYLIHDYDNLDLDTVWDSIVHGLPELRSTVQELLTELDRATEPDDSPEPF